MGLLDALKQYVADSMPGGLLNPEFNSTNGQKLAAELQRGLLESTGINARDKRRAWNKNQLDAVSGSSDTRGSLDKEAYETAMNMAGMAPMGLTVWHGSPHKFSKFDMSKIGTGEGAQAYGHGLYMAENPIVAKEYQNMVRAELDGKPFTPGAFDPEFGALDALHKAGNDYSAAESILKDRAARQKVDLTPEIDALASMQKKGVKANLGAMYKVDIPDEAVARMLDWDKPLSQQAPEVQKAMAKVIEKKNPRLAQYLQESSGLDDAGQTAVRKRLGINIFDTIDTGGAAYQAAGQGNVEGLLKSMGIPGIRYLDGGSRGTGSGTSNYVLFSDQLPRILETNGVPTGQAPWEPGEWQGLLQSQSR